MKIRIKYSSTRKFAVEILDPTLENLKKSVKNFITSAYGDDIEDVILSFNGKDPITGSSSDSLSSLGIVTGDLLSVILPSVESSNKEALPGPSSVQSKLRDSEADSGPTKMASQKEEKGSRESSKTSPEAGCHGASTYEGDRSDASNYTLGSKITCLLDAKDGHPPNSVTEFFEIYSPTSSSQAINLLVHITMLESGFTLHDSSSTVRNLPPSWKEMVATLKYSHPGFNNFISTIVLVTMGGIKQVLASFEGQESEISVRLEMKDYLQTNQIFPHRLTKLAQLARTLRNKLLYPLQVAAHLTLGLPAPWHLEGIPQEILVHIASHLDLNSVLNLSATCKSLHSASADNKLWYNLFKRDFKNQYHSSDTISGADWKAKYKAAFLYRKELKKSEKDSRRYVFPEPPIPDFPNRPNFPIPGIDPNNPFMPQPRGPDPYYPPQPYPEPNPFWDPDSPYFGGEIPPPPGPFFPTQPNPFDPYNRMRPRRPNNPLQPPFMPPQPRNPRGPRFDFI